MESCAERGSRLNLISGQVLDAAIEVHRVLGGPGLLETIYEEALAREMELRGFKVERQIPVPVFYKGHAVKHPLFLDLLIEKEVVVEVKSVETFNPLYKSQVLTYLRLSDKRLGLIVNFGEIFVKDGFHRIVNNFP